MNLNDITRIVGRRTPLTVTCRCLASISVISILFVTACGASTPSPHSASTAAGDPTIAASQPATSVAPSPAGAPATSGGILAVACDGTTTQQVMLIDPQTGSTTAVPVPAPSDISTAGPGLSVGLRWCPTNPSSLSDRLAVREDFDKSLTRVVAWTSIQGDGFGHVGWVDVATHAFTDITAANMSTGFSADTPADSQPLFDVVTGDFWFLRNHGTIYHCLTGQTTCTAAGSNGGSVGQYGHDGLRFVVVNGVVQLADGLNGAEISPLGTTYATSGEFEGLQVVPGGPDRTVRNLGTGPSGNVVGFTVGGKKAGCLVEAWVSDTSLLCGDQINPSQLYLVKDISPSTTGSVAGVAVLPPNSRNNVNPVASPDGTSVAFLSGPDLYTVGLGGSLPVAPVKVAAALSPSAFLVSWE